MQHIVSPHYAKEVALHNIILAHLHTILVLANPQNSGKSSRQNDLKFCKLAKNEYLVVMGMLANAHKGYGCRPKTHCAPHYFLDAPLLTVSQTTGSSTAHNYGPLPI